MPVSNIIIGEVANPPVIFDKYELWLLFDTGDTEVEIMFPDQVLKRVNEWNAVLPLTGEEQASAVTHDFPWPVYDHSVAAPIVSLSLYYYDVHGRKCRTELVYS